MTFIHLHISQSSQEILPILDKRWVPSKQAWLYLINIGHMSRTFPSSSKDQKWFPHTLAESILHRPHSEISGPLIQSTDLLPS
jgi:hypothetical protein